MVEAVLTATLCGLAAWWSISRWQCRTAAKRLYALHRTMWGEAHPWRVVDEPNPEPWRLGEALKARELLESFGFRWLGYIQHSIEPVHEHGPVMTILFGDNDTVWAAAYEVSGHEVVEFESRFPDGDVIETSNNELAGRMTSPPSIAAVHRAFNTQSGDLLAEHRERVRSKARAGAGPERCESLEALVQEQNRQIAEKQRARLAFGYVLDDELRKIALSEGLSPWKAEVLVREYRLIVEKQKQTETTSASGRAAQQ